MSRTVGRKDKGSSISGVVSGAVMALGVGVCVLVPLVARKLGFGEPYGLAAAAIATAALLVVARRFSTGVVGGNASLDKIAATLIETAEKATEAEMLTLAQHSLDKNLQILQTALRECGEARVVNGVLYYGQRRINDDVEIVDSVRQSAGGTATVFLGDLRIATNVLKPDGSRAVGTRLTAEKVIETVLKQGKVFRGEAEILGEAYYTIYEPILSDGKVVGILYVGVRKAEFAAQHGDDLGSAGAAEAVNRALLALQRSAKTQADTARDAIVQRQEAEDLRRQQEARRQAVAAEQRLVVEGLSAALERLARGDMSMPIKAIFPAEYEKLRSDYNTTLESLRNLIAEISGGVGSLSEGARDISSAADQLAHRTEQQAASLEQTAAALNEITNTVRATSAGAGQAKTAVDIAHGDVERSGQTMIEAVNAMGRIEASARQMELIIATIDEIAFQTNLLALNAGVEAARAGESGRGFAVVAQEVRALAQRSAGAAREIKGLISSSSQQVSLGADLVNETGAALGKVVDQVREVSRLVSEIARSAVEQTSGLDEVNIAVNQMDRFTQQNAAMVEESTAASHSIRAEASRLMSKVSVFKLSEDHEIASSEAA